MMRLIGLCTALLAIAVPRAGADDCFPLTAYPIGSSGIVRLTWVAGTQDDTNIRYTLSRGTLTDAIKVISITANKPVTNVILDQTTAADTYFYQVQSDTLDGTLKPAANGTRLSKQASVVIPARQATTLIAETFDDNRLDPTVWVAPKGANLKIEEGRLVLGPKTTISVTVPPPSSSAKLSPNGMDIVARVLVDSSFAITSKTDQVAASIGFETTATSDGYIVELALHDLCGTPQVQLLYTPKQGSPSKPGTPIPIDNKPQVAAPWDTASFYWLKLKLDRKAGKVLAWTWKDGDTNLNNEDASKAIASLDLPKNLLKDPKTLDPKTLDVAPKLFGKDGTVSFGEVILSDLSTASPPSTTPTTYHKPEPPTSPPTKPPCLVACRPAPLPLPDKCKEPLPPLRFNRQWPNSAVAIAVRDTITPGKLWKMPYRGLSVKRLDRTVEEELLLARGGLSDEGFVPSNPDLPFANVEFQDLDHLFVFLGPAMFPLPRFDNACPPIEDDGAIIQESMNLRAKDGGEFEVEFRVAAPALPVTLRLQLGLHRGQEDFGLITLPPMVLDNQDLDPNEEHGDTWRVVYHGYSRALARALDWCGLKKPPYPIEITRHGAARFGSGVTTLGLTYQQ